MFDLSISKDGTPKYPEFFSVKSVLITLYESTAMGLPKSFQSKSKIIRIIWFFLFLGAFTVTFYYVSYNLDVYNQNNVNTLIELARNNENLLLEFPSVSICLISSNRNISFNLSDILDYCQFGLDEHCDENDFITYFDLNYGKCFRFNAVKNQTNLGVSNGLKLLINTENTTLINGFQLVIHNKTEFPNSNQCISAASNGFVTNIGISKQTETKPGQPFNMCEDDFSANKSSLIDYFLEKNLTYRQNDCFYFIFLKYFGLKCSIEGKYLEVIQNYFLNYTYDTNVCYHEALKQFSIDYNDSFNTSVCPLECSTSRFIPSVYYYKLMNESISEINIYYNNYPLIVISQTPEYSITDLIANVGGTSGLFLGASLITPLELIEIIYKLIGTLFIKIYNKIKG